jgi:hypothetical protein
MRSNNRAYIVIAVLLVLVSILVYQFYYKKKLDWSKTYNDGLFQPYDFGLFKEVVKGSSKKFTEYSSGMNYFESKDEAIATSTYLFIGKTLYLRNWEMDTLLNRVSRGSKAVIITENHTINFTNFLYRDLGIEQQQNFIDDSVEIASNYSNSKLGKYVCKYFNGEKFSSIYWNCYVSKVENEDVNRYFERGKIHHYTNSVKVKYGKGELLLHCEPLLFTNYYLKEQKGFIYTNEILNDIDFKNTVYDIDSRSYKIENINNERRENADLRFILKNKSTRTAWYLFLLGLVLFVLFKLKREQRMMPVAALKRNSSLSFINTISSLYFSRVNSREMAKIKMNLFLYFIKYQLNISTNNLSAERYKLIAMKTGCETEQIQKIFEFYKMYIEESKSRLDSLSLIKFNISINRIYKSYYKK